MATRFTNPAPQFFYNGTPAAPLSGGLMYFYEPGASLTPKDTYSNNGLSVANSNPVVLSASGVLPNVFLDGAYRVILKDKDGVQQWDKDSVNSTSELAFSAWDTTIDYGIGGTNIVYASNGFYYVSIQTPNLGQEPSVSPTYWQLAIDYFLESQQAIEPGHIGVGGDPDGIVSLNTKTKGTIPVGNGTTTTTLAVGTDTHVLTADSTQPLGVKWAVAPGNARDYQPFTTSGTWTKPEEAEFVFVEIWGGGGGGGSNTGAVQIGGGSGGEYVCKWFMASDLAATETVTIGAGGSGGAFGTNPGSAGGNTTFGSLLTATGGNPGTTGAVYATVPRSRAATAATATAGQSFSVTVFPQSGYGGSSSLGGNTIYGGAGGGGNAFAGGTSAYGGNGGAGTDTLNTAGGAGTAPGGGGGGSGQSDASGGGGAGARGEARVWTW